LNKDMLYKCATQRKCHEKLKVGTQKIAL